MKQKTIPDHIRELLNSSDKSWYQIAKDAGLQPSTLQRVKEEGWGTQLETANKALATIGYELTIRKTDID